MDDTDVGVVIPTYNEADNIHDLVVAIRGVLGNNLQSLVVVDDASPDGTGNIVEALAESMPCLELVARDRRKGIGSACQEGFEAVEGDVVVQMDADFSHHPKQIPDLVAATEDADVVIGSRYVDGGERQDSLHRRFFPLIGSYLYRFLLKSPVKDVTNGFRAYNASWLEVVMADNLPDGFSFLPASLFRLIGAGATVVEIPTTFRQRRSGEPKYTLRVPLDNAMVLLRLVINRQIVCCRQGVRRIVD